MLATIQGPWRLPLLLLLLISSLTLCLLLLALISTLLLILILLRLILVICCCLSRPSRYLLLLQRVPLGIVSVVRQLRGVLDCDILLLDPAAPDQAQH